MSYLLNNAVTHILIKHKLHFETYFFYYDNTNRGKRGSLALQEKLDLLVILANLEKLVPKVQEELEVPWLVQNMLT